MYNILICDDEPDIVSALKIYLASDGYGIYEAYNGREAIEMMQKTEIHLVLMDIMMPEMDGIQTMVKIREAFQPAGADCPGEIPAAPLYAAWRWKHDKEESCHRWH